MRKRRIYTLLGIFVILIIVNTLLAAYVNTPKITSCIPSLYFAVVFSIASALWFGIWGVAAAYIGCFIGAGIMGGVPIGINIYWSLADVWQSLIPLVAFRLLEADIGLRKRRDFLIYLAFGWLLNNLAGAIWGASMLTIGGEYSWNDFPTIFTNWFNSNLIVNIVITPLILKYVTPYLRRIGILIEWINFKSN